MIEEYYEVAVIGGGLSGVIAALAAARSGISTVPIQDRPVLGGNASSEFRMHVCGADNHAKRPNARETGIIEEILLENKRVNPDYSYPIFDMLLLNKVQNQDNLALHLNTYVNGVKTTGSYIDYVYGFQTTTEKEFKIYSSFFVDATGDGSISFKAGADYVIGRESKATYGESLAPDIADNVTMGNSIMFQARRVGHKVSFIKPDWAYSYSEKELAFREHRDVESGYWWIESGGLRKDTIKDGEEVHDELLKILYGIWDHIKNSPGHDSDNLLLDWVSPIAGKRESRRILGDYVLSQKDISDSRIFNDAVAYGGWTMDLHTPGGFASQEDVPTVWNPVEDVYTIPFSCFYSRNIGNLFVAGRIISASHVAFSSSRVMGTCASGAEAVGNALAIAIKNNLKDAREVGRYIKELQQILLKNDAFIPDIINEDSYDIARSATVTASSFIQDGNPENVISGISRPWKGNENAWICNIDSTPSISLKYQRSIINEIRITFDSDFSHEITPSIIKSVLDRQEYGVPSTPVKEFRIKIIDEGNVVFDNIFCTEGQRHLIIPIGKIHSTEMEISLYSSYGKKIIKVFEIRIY